MKAEDTLLTRCANCDGEGAVCRDCYWGLAFREGCIAQAEVSFKAGIKEVVEYVTTNLLLYGPNYDEKEAWYARLKEWKIEE